MSTEILEIVKQNPNFEFLENGKIRCKLTNHEMNPDIAKYNEYIKSKGYQKAIEKDFNFDQYRPHIVPFKGAEDNFLWCHLTKTKVPKMKCVILRHVEGKKYQRLISLFNQKKQEREERKKITLLKSKKLTKEEDDDKFDERFIDRMIMEFEEDERLNDQDLDGEESYSEDLYSKIHANGIEEDAPKKNLSGNKSHQMNGGDLEEDEEELDSENEEQLEDDEEEAEGDDNNEVDVEEEIPDTKEDQKENNNKQSNKFQHNSKKFNENKQHNPKQGFQKQIQKNKQNNFKKHFNKNKFQKK